MTGLTLLAVVVGLDRMGWPALEPPVVAPGMGMFLAGMWKAGRVLEAAARPPDGQRKHPKS
ncbi:hypothetical protein [Micromonospora sp. WMMD737]|uniref:hypothetical protein n=1 Tax=Micromonospora sp. WMMD737 TaxID=3404113 RepID=UPI003B92ED3B